MTEDTERPPRRRIRYRAERFCDCLHIEVDADADLNGTFKAVCLDTGDFLWVDGWEWELYRDEGEV